MSSKELVKRIIEEEERVRIPFIPPRKIFLPVKSESRFIKKTHLRTIDTYWGPRTIVINPSKKKIIRNRLMFQKDMNKVLAAHPVIIPYLKRMSVKISGKETDATATIGIARRVLILHPDYFSHPESSRFNTLLHEIGHLVVDEKMPFMSFMMGKREAFVEIGASMFALSPEFIIGKNRKWFIDLWRKINHLKRKELDNLALVISAYASDCFFRPKDFTDKILAKDMVEKLMNHVFYVSSRSKK